MFYLKLTVQEMKALINTEVVEVPWFDVSKWH